MSYFAAGGKVGFFLAPAMVTPALDILGLAATVLFIPPAVLMAFVLTRHLSRTHDPATGHRRPRHSTDCPRLFAVLACVEIVRSTLSFGLNTFVSLYWISYLGASAALGGTALTIEPGGGVLGTLAGGRIADRLGMVRTVQLGNVLVLPALITLLACTNKYGALLLVLFVGVAIGIPFAVLIKLGQDYLPTRPGTAAGVTLGPAVSAGGLFMPLLGLLADHHGPRGVLVVLTTIPLLALAMSAALREPMVGPVATGSPSG